MHRRVSQTQRRRAPLQGGGREGGREIDGVREREREEVESTADYNSSDSPLSAALQLQLPIHRAGKQTTGEGNICMGA